MTAIIKVISTLFPVACIQIETKNNGRPGNGGVAAPYRENVSICKTNTYIIFRE